MLSVGLRYGENLQVDWAKFSAKHRHGKHLENQCARYVDSKPVNACRIPLEILENAQNTYCSVNLDFLAISKGSKKV